jgi:hypothetical protein
VRWATFWDMRVFSFASLCMLFIYIILLYITSIDTTLSFSRVW